MEGILNLKKMTDNEIILKNVLEMYIARNRIVYDTNVT